MGNDAVHRDRVAACLRALGRDHTIVRYEVLQGGISGAPTYRVHLANEQVVLKIAAETSPPGVLACARREIHFYRDLADSIPLQIPAVLGTISDTSASCLCLRAYQVAPPIETWSERHYREIAGQLGQFHAAFWKRTEELSHLSWLRQLASPPDGTTLQHATESWHALAGLPNYQTVLTSAEIAWIEAMVSHMDYTDSVLQAFPMTLCHGDCHHGNLLMDGDGEWRWADWQEVGIGRGPEDLSFFLQRARMAGGAVPEDAVVRAYHQCLEAAAGQSIRLTTVKQVVDASELRTLLLLWPPFLSRVPVQQLREIVRRLHLLTDRLGLARQTQDNCESLKPCLP